MKEPPHPALAQGKVRHVGDPVAFVVAETLEQAQRAAEARVVDYEVLPAVVGVLEAIKRDAPLSVRRCAGQSVLRLGAWRQGGDRCRLRARPRMLRASAWSTTGWSAIRWSRARPSPNTIAATGQHTLWTTSQFPHVVRLLMGAFVLNIPQHKLRVVAPDVGGGFGVKQFHYAEEAVITWAGRENRPADQMGLRAERRLYLRRTGPRPRDRSRACARRERQVPRAAGQHARQYRRLHLDFRSEHPDQSLRTAAGRRLL